MSLENKLDSLRAAWVEARPADKKILEMRAKLVKMAMDRRNGDTERNVREAFL